MALSKTIIIMLIVIRIVIVIKIRKRLIAIMIIIIIVIIMIIMIVTTQIVLNSSNVFKDAEGQGKPAADQWIVGRREISDIWRSEVWLVRYASIHTYVHIICTSEGQGKPAAPTGADAVDGRRLCRTASKV